MKELLTEIQATVFMEYERAKAKFGAANNGPHESYAVILEEFDEAFDKGAKFKWQLDFFWKSVKDNTSGAVFLDAMRQFAEEAAAEWIQVAAMCYKATKKKGEKP